MELNKLKAMDGRKRAPLATPLLRQTNTGNPSVADVRFFLSVLEKEIAKKGFYEGCHSPMHLFLPYAIQYAQENGCDYTLDRIQGRYALKLWKGARDDGRVG